MTQLSQTSVYNFLQDLFLTRFSVERIRGVDHRLFFQTLEQYIGTTDADKEGFLDATKQRDLSIKYHWGHDHDFGQGIHYKGPMGDRHIAILTHFIVELGLPLDLTGKRVLDIGVWTGGTSLLLAAMGANVVALEEVAKYADTVSYLAHAFSLQEQMKCLPRSLFDALPMFADEFDYVIYSGVIYHVSDPLLSLRLIFSALKDSGACFIETYGFYSTESICRYEGPRFFHTGRKEDLNRTGWNYFVPSSTCLTTWCQDVGFQETKVSLNGPGGPDLRLFAVAQRTRFEDFCRAGMSKRMCR